MMTYNGHVEKGAIVLDEPVDLPEGAGVRVELLLDLSGKPLHPDIVRFSGIIPEDLDVDQARYDAIMQELQ